MIKIMIVLLVFIHSIITVSITCQVLGTQQ